MMRVVFDCMVFLQAAGRPFSPANACLKLVYDGHLQLFLTPSIFAEIQDVLHRPKVRRSFPLLDDEAVTQMLNTVLQTAVMVETMPERYVLERDVKDSIYINLAIAAQAHYLVSRDNDLLDLMEESSMEGQTFRFQFPDLTILDPVALLHLIGFQQATP